MNKENLHSISNSQLTCTISELGAEIISLKTNDNEQEYMWKADPAIWAGSAPILFPIVGRLREGKYTIGGQEYTLPTHGFIGTQCFKVKDRTESSITFSVSSSSSTMPLYPFMFQLDVTFSLVQRCLTVTYKVSNKDNKTMCFAIGSHPAFALPINEFSQEKCTLRFSAQEKQHCQLIKNELLSEEQFPVSFTDNTLTLTPTLFYNDALIFRGVLSSFITLMVDSEPVLSLEMGNNMHLGLWAKPNSPYICLEPWTATDETINSPFELNEKPDMNSLAVNETYTNFYTINIL